ncbi:D-tagatose-1,6-bisphosphate aldolase subunit GatY [Clostridium luticellarii]|jgi:fructose-bisphosphate aldolase class II|uniref:D-tagatose-1,6-bisphosphate aldolase subunit GatY n=2 Tax=Clostridium luticellarii TaxID=1691940 RepID=A0A2T0BSF0_9CLOT|nr:D-tagatose-1,6-bisphosphate aldolase subunit GatY [Clostridium luticellarii]
MLEDAHLNKYAVGSFNVYNFETIKGVLESADELKKPVIVAFGEKYLDNMDPETVYAVVNSLSKNIDTPVALHLDHCKSFDHIIQAVRAGFTSVMFDGSSLDFKENLKRTGEITSIAHAVGVTVEAELGALTLGEYSNEDDGRQIYTDPDQAEEFVSETKVDALAVSIGTVHGMYKGEPKIDIDVLKAISSKIETPLVLHGGSGTPEATIRECISNGICKINVNTEISMYTVNKVKEALKSDTNYHLSKISLMEVKYIKEVVEKYMDMFYGA